MPEPAQSSRHHRVRRPFGLVGRLEAPLLLGVLTALLGVPAACGGGSGTLHPPVSTGPIPPAPPREQAAPPDRVERGGVHVVERGETLWGIGRRYGVSIRALMQANDIGPQEVTTLQVGRVLRIPASAQPTAMSAPPRAATASRSAPAPSPRASAAAPSMALLAAAHLGQARDRYEAADFEGAIEDAREAGRLLRGLEDSPARRGQRARASLVEGMAEAALGDSTGALTSFREARRLDPDLSLDPTTTSPKLISLFEQAAAGP